MSAERLGRKYAIYRPGLYDDHNADKEHGHEHVDDASETRRDLGHVLMLEFGECGAKAHTERGNAEGHHKDRGDAESHHERSYLEERIRENDKRFGEHEEGEQAAPKLCPQEITDRKRRRADDPERCSLEAYGGGNETAGDGLVTEYSHNGGQKKRPVLKERDRA